MADVLKCEIILLSVIYLTLLLGISAISTILTVAILNMFHKDGERDMANWQQYLIFNCLGRVVRKKREAQPFLVTRNPRGQVEPQPINNVCKQGMLLADIGRSLPMICDNSGTKKDDPTLRVLQELLNGEREKRKQIEEDMEKATVRKKWVTGARIIDKFLMYVYLVTTISITLICVVIIPTIPRPLRETH